MFFSELSFASNRGFLPVKNPLQKLPEHSRLNQLLNNIANNIPLFIKEKRLRTMINNLNKEYANEKIILDETDTQEKAIAFLILLMIAQGYVWEDSHNPANILPEILSINIYHLSKIDQRFPTLSYTDYVLNNWHMLSSDKEITLQNIQPIFTFTGSVDEEWFIKIHVVIEAACGAALSAAYKATLLADSMFIENIYFPDLVKETELTILLQQIENSIRSAVILLKQMTLHCNPNYFYNVLRIFLSGWENIKTLDNNKEIKGVKLAGIDATHSHSYRGASGAQSSIIPALDSFLGIKHEINSMFITLLTFKQYMPHKHQFFIASLAENKVNRVISLSQCRKLASLWQSIINQIAIFRAQHIEIVHQYIFQPAQTKGLGLGSLVGTGGAPMSYLDVRHKSTTVTIV